MYAFLSSVSSWENARTRSSPDRVTKTLIFFLSTQLSLWATMLVCLSVFLCILMYVFLSPVSCLSICLTVCSPVYLSACLFPYLSVCLSVLLVFCLSVYLLSLLPACLCGTVTLQKNTVVYIKRYVSPSVSLFSCLFFECLYRYYMTGNAFKRSWYLFCRMIYLLLKIGI